MEMFEDSDEDLLRSVRETQTRDKEHERMRVSADKMERVLAEEEKKHGDEEKSSKKSKEKKEKKTSPVVEEEILEDEGGEDSGLEEGVEYFPYEKLGVRVASKKTVRLRELVSILGVDTNNEYNWPIQSLDPTAAINMPFMVQFTQKCHLQTPDEVRQGKKVYAVIMGMENDRVYVMFLEGSRLIEHYANVGEDGNVYPFSTLSAAAKELYGTNSNGWEKFVVCDSTSPHNGKSLKILKHIQFKNTLSSALMEAWSKPSKTVLNHQAMYHLDLFRGVVGSQISGKKKAAQEKKTTAKTAKKTKKRLPDDEKKSVEKKRKVINTEEQELRNKLLAKKTFRPSVSEQSRKVFEERAARKSLALQKRKQESDDDQKEGVQYDDDDDDENDQEEGAEIDGEGQVENDGGRDEEVEGEGEGDDEEEDEGEEGEGEDDEDREGEDDDDEDEMSDDPEDNIKSGKRPRHYSIRGVAEKSVASRPQKQPRLSQDAALVAKKTAATAASY